MTARPAIVAVSCVLAAAAAGAQEIDTLALRDHARVLAHDSLRGRATGTPGETMAAAYIAGQLERAGVLPGDAAGYRMSLPLLRVRLVDWSRVIVTSAADTSVFRAGRDFIMTGGGRNSLRGFAGPAVVVPDAGIADPATLAGKVVVTGGITGAAARDIMRAWVRAGVAGVILPVAVDADLAALGTGREWLAVDADVDEPVWQPELPVVIAGGSLVRAILEPKMRTPGASPHVLADLNFDVEPLASANVIGRIPGLDPQPEGEILLVAHYDHLGTDPTLDTDSIYNGFSDNAAGVAMALEVAATLVRSPARLPVRVLFTSGEERGLLGSSFAASRPGGADSLVAVLNLDAGAPPAPPRRWRVAGDSASAAVRTAAAVVTANGWAVDITGFNANSDHWPFFDRGVPAVFLVPGREYDDLDADEATALFARWDRYHRPDDEWDPDYPLAGVGRFAQLALEIVYALSATTR